MSDKKILNIIIICTVISFSAGIVSAAPPNLPVILYGNVNIDGNPAPVGTTITATAGTSPAGATNVLSAGTYGEVANGRLPVSAADGAKVEFYVNGIKATPSISFAYNLNDAGKLFRVDLNAQSSGGGTIRTSSSSGSGGGSGTGTVTKKETTTATQTAVSTRESVPGTTGVKETATTSETPSTAKFQFFSVLGTFVLLATGSIILYALKKAGKI